MKIRTVTELDDRIRDDLTWRKHEIRFFDQQLSQVGKIAQRSLLRASVALLYAHWEGFIKTACHYYLCYIASLKLSNDKLTPELTALSLRTLLSRSIDTRSAILHKEMVEGIRENGSERANIPTYRDAIQTASNLSYPVLENILRSIGLDPAQYEYARDLIDTQLVNSRNKIAHGENDYIEQSEWSELESEVLKIMDAVSTQLVNSALNSSYQRNDLKAKL